MTICPIDDEVCDCGALRCRSVEFDTDAWRPVEEVPTRTCWPCLVGMAVLVLVAFGAS